MTSPRFADRCVQDCLGWKQRIEIEEKTAQQASSGNHTFRGHGPYVYDNYLIGGAVDVVRQLKHKNQQQHRHHHHHHTKSSASSTLSTTSRATTNSRFTAPSERKSTTSTSASSAVRRLTNRMESMEKAIMEERQDTQRMHDDLSEIKQLLIASGMGRRNNNS
eukprot:PhF_6_TR9721/c0_g1_i2/m.14963